MLTGLTSWIFGVDSASAENSAKVDDGQKCLEEPEFIERHGPRAGRRRPILCKNIGNSWHGGVDYPNHRGHEPRRTIRNQGSTTKRATGGGARKTSAAMACKDRDSKKGLNDEGWVWVCDEKEIEPTPEAFEHDYAWYALEDQIDLNTISIHNEWQIAPPSCFTGTPIPEEKRLTTRLFDRQELNDLDDLPIGEVSMFENLLIEHPSMSIYDKFPERAANLQRVQVGEEAQSHRNINDPAVDQSSTKLKSLENTKDPSPGPLPDHRVPTTAPLIIGHRRRSRSVLKHLLNYINDGDPYFPPAADENDVKFKMV